MINRLCQKLSKCSRIVAHRFNIAIPNLQFSNLLNNYAYKMNHFTRLIEQCANQIVDQLVRQGNNFPIDSMVILGSGLNELANDFETVAEIGFDQIEALPKPTAPSHIGKISVCKVGSKTVAFCRGRFHLYEGYSAQEVSILVYALSRLGASQLIVSNAAGGLNPLYRPGDIMVIEDHINFTGQNPIVGQDDSVQSRFADMSNAYDVNLRSIAYDLACRLELQAHLGVYAGVLGPSLETSAERRMLHQWGADAVGMSTVTEVIAANHCKMEVLGLSAITNVATGSPEQQPDTIEEVLHYASIAAGGIKKIISSALSS